MLCTQPPWHEPLHKSSNNRSIRSRESACVPHPPFVKVTGQVICSEAAPKRWVRKLRQRRGARERRHTAKQHERIPL